MAVPKALTDRRALIKHVALFCGEYQFPRLALKHIILFASAKNIFVVANSNDFCFRIFFKYLFGTRVVPYFLFYINMGEKRVKITVV